MSQWEQSYYTWSTNCLSGNKVGLGIVASSRSDDHVYMRIAEQQGAGSNVCRGEEQLTIEKLSYNEELGGWIRSGATPCPSGADKRNNKFVHLYSLKDEKGTAPEDYLLPLSYLKEWDGNQVLSSVTVRKDYTQKGRQLGISILQSLQLEQRLPELFCCVYRCLLAGERPLSIVSKTTKKEDFSEFSRKMMILIHDMLPSTLRKEADYVSYIQEDSQEAHFLFRKEGGNFTFDLDGKSGQKKEYALLEKEFYEKLSRQFLKPDASFERQMEELDRFLNELQDKRNQLEKCIFAFMASEVSKAKDKDAFFTGMERLMYWARKDDSLVPALKEATKELDFHEMEEKELSAYTGLLLTGAGGKTKDMAYEELNRMVRYFYKTDDSLFSFIMDQIRKKNHTVYEQLLKENKKGNGFTRSVLHQPIQNKADLLEAVSNHSVFLKDEEYRHYLVTAAYGLYEKSKTAAGKKEMEEIGKQIDREAFVCLKEKEVKKALGTINTLSGFFSFTKQMEMKELEPSIGKMLYQSAMELFYEEYQTFPLCFLPETEKKSKKHQLAGREGTDKEKIKEYKTTVSRLLSFGEQLSLQEEMKKALGSYYDNLFGPVISAMSHRELLALSFWNQENRQEDQLYLDVIKKQALFRYLTLLKEDTNGFYQLPVREWIHFVLKLTEGMEKTQKKAAKEAIGKTKEAILQKNDLFFLAEANQALKNHGLEGIRCPKELWNGYSVRDFGTIYDRVTEIKLIQCEESEVSQAISILYQFVHKKMEKDSTAKLTQMLKKKPETGEDLLRAMAVLWGSNPNLDLSVFYPVLEKQFGEKEASLLMEEAVKGRKDAQDKWMEYEKEYRKKVEREMRKKEQINPVKNIIEDVMSGSIWGAVFGLYGYFLVSLREFSEFKAGYRMSIILLVILAAGYILLNVTERRRKSSPAGHLYIAGVSIFLMNLALAMDQMKGVILLFVISIVLSLILKLIFIIVNQRY